MEPPALSARRLRTDRWRCSRSCTPNRRTWSPVATASGWFTTCGRRSLIEELLATRHDDFTKLNYLPEHGELQQARGRLIMSEERAEHVAARKALGRLMSGAPLAEISLALDEQLARSVPAAARRPRACRRRRTASPPT